MKQKGTIMDDEKLITSLRGCSSDEAMWSIEAANRIEAIGKACKEWAEVSQSNYQRAKAAEARVQTLLQQSAEHAETVAALIDRVAELEEALRLTIVFTDWRDNVGGVTPPPLINAIDRARAVLAGRGKC